MSELPSLNFKIYLDTSANLILRCHELNCEIKVTPSEVEEYSILQTGLSKLVTIVENNLVELIDKDATNKLATVLIPSDYAIELKHYAFRAKLEQAFVANYPKAKEHWDIMSLIPGYDWGSDDEGWTKEKAAYDDLITNGNSGKLWIDYVQLITEMELPKYAKDQQKLMYEEWVTLGLPVKTIEDILNQIKKRINNKSSSWLFSKIHKSP